MRLPHSFLSHGKSSLWVWAAAFSPALLILVMLWPLLVSMPYLDAWAFVLQYQHWLEGTLYWREFLALHYVHPSAVGKAIHFAVLHWLGGNMGLLTLLTWMFAVVVMGCVCVLSRPLWVDNHRRGVVLMFLAGLTVCSAAQGEVWVWGFLFQNSIPGVCLILGLVTLSTCALTTGRILIAALLNAVAIFSFGSGLLVGMLLSVQVWRGMAERSVAQRGLITGAWLAFTGIVAWFALSAPSGSDESVSATILLDRPLMRLRFVLVLLGQMLGKGTVFEPEWLCAVMGVSLVMVFVTCGLHVFRRRRDQELVSASLPWIACSLYGGGSALLICIVRSFNSLSNSLAERYAALSLFFVLGTVLLAATVMWHGAPDSALVRWMRKATGPALAVFLVAQAANWQCGWNAMKLKSKTMEQEQAMMAFARVLPPGPEWMKTRLTRKSSLKMVPILADSNRLPGVKLVPDNRIASFPSDRKARSQWARFDKPHLLDDGHWRLGGIGGLSAETAVDLILITAESAGAEERIIALTAPFLPDPFFERQTETRRHPEHYLGWKHTLAPASLRAGPQTLRAYFFDQDKHRVRPMEGVHKVEVLPN